jgi:sugar/nucleoside kinase (ribokinase family)
MHGSGGDDGRCGMCRGVSVVVRGPRVRDVVRWLTFGSASSLAVRSSSRAIMWEQVSSRCGMCFGFGSVSGASEGVVDTTGAGDAFAAGFFAGLTRTMRTHATRQTQSPRPCMPLDTHCNCLRQLIGSLIHRTAGDASLRDCCAAGCLAGSAAVRCEGATVSPEGFAWAAERLREAGLGASWVGPGRQLA